MMRSASPKLRRLAGRLLAIEGDTGDAGGPAAFRVCERLRRPLSTMAGETGVRALMSRALALAGDEVCWLKAVQVEADGSFAGLDEAQLSAAEIAEGGTVLIAQLIALLVTFIGETLTLRLLREAWPEASLGGLNPEPEREP